MIGDLVLHDSTRAAVEQFSAAPVHGLLILGSAGSGKKTVALAVIEEKIGPLSNNPYFLHITAEGTSISIETIRRLQEFVKLRTTGQATWRRAILVEDAHLLTIEAQNAFLKLLEEPPADTLIILTATLVTDLLPTITSRAQKITLKPLSQERLQQHFNSATDQQLVTRAYHMSNGRIGLMNRLLDDGQNQELLAAIDQAKQFLRQQPFERLVFVDQFTKQKQSLTDFLWALLAVSRAALYQAGKQDNTVMVERWQKIITTVLTAQESLAAHPLPKLLLTDLSLQI